MSSSPWKWDWNSSQYVYGSEQDGSYFNQTSQRVSNVRLDQPATVASSSRATPNATFLPGNAPGRKSSNDVSKATASNTSLESKFQNLGISSASKKGGQSASGAARGHTAVDPSTGAETRWDSVQSTQVAGSSLRSYDPKRVLELEGRKDQQVLQGYRISNQPQADYKRGRVIEVILVPPQAPGSTASGITPNDAAIATVLPPRTIARLRRFVIVRENIDGRNTFEAIAIKTYNGQGVAAPRVIKSHHAIIYTGQLPNLTGEEQPRRMPNGQPETGVLPQAIRVVTYDRGTALDPMARLDYGDRYLFEAGVPNIRLWGRVHDDFHAALFVQYTQVWAAIQRAVQGVAPSPGAATTAQSTTTEVPRPRIDPTSADSGPISDEAMEHILKQYKDHAERNDLHWPTQRLNPAQIHGLAMDAARRAVYLRRIRDSWKEDGNE